MLEIIEPRYRDHSVLLAQYKLTPGYPAKIHIRRGAYSGDYEVSAKDIASAPSEMMKTKNGSRISMKAVPLKCLVRIGEPV